MPGRVSTVLLQPFEERDSPERRLVRDQQPGGQAADLVGDEDYIAHNNAERMRLRLRPRQAVRARSAYTFPNRREQLGLGTDSPSRMTVGSLVTVCLRHTVAMTQI
jgi:hypothetical protein